MNVRFAVTAVGLSGLLCVAAANAATVVKVALQDPSTGPGVTSMHIALDRDSVPAGRVTFRATNQSKDQIHELIVVRTEAAQASLPYDEKKAQVIEKRVHHLGEISDLKPGHSGSMMLNLRPGSYILICNQAGHYKAGMSTPFTVTK